MSNQRVKQSLLVLSSAFSTMQGFSCDSQDPARNREYARWLRNPMQGTNYRGVGKAETKER